MRRAKGSSTGGNASRRLGFNWCVNRRTETGIVIGDDVFVTGEASLREDVVEPRIDAFDMRAQILESQSGLFNEVGNIRIHVHITQVRAVGDTETLDTLHHPRAIVGRRVRHRIPVPGIRRGNHTEHKSGIGDRANDWTLVPQ